VVNKLLLMKRKGLVPGAVAYWDCTQVVGQVLPDLSGNGNHATLGSTTGADTNDPTAGPTGLTFGGDDFVTHPTISFAEGATHTYMAVVRWPGNAPTDYVAPFGDRSSAQSTVYIAGPGGAQYLRFTPAAGARATSTVSTSALFSGGYHTVAWTMSPLGLLTIYIDGSLGGTVQTPSSSMVYNSIGSGYTVLTYSWIGDICGVAIHPTEASSPQVAQNHAYFRAKFAPLGVILP
jgi:hypothetical protein